MKTLWPSLLWLHRLKESLLPRPFERMAIQGYEGIIGAEIGVFEGDHAAVMLKNADIRLLYLVDPYVAYNDYGQKRLKAALETAQKTTRAIRRPLRLVLPELSGSGQAATA